jgi:threonine synthase
MPGAVIVPAGQGGLLLGLSRGFGALRIACNIGSFPKLIGVQARACAPLWVMFTAEGKGSGYVPENSTQAEGVRVRFPLRGGAVVAAVKESGGMVVVVDEEDLLPGRDALARLGFYVEPTSAIVWSALTQTIQDLADPVVVVLTGSGLKSV